MTNQYTSARAIQENLQRSTPRDERARREAQILADIRDMLPKLRAQYPNRHEMQILDLAKRTVESHPRHRTHA